MVFQPAAGSFTKSRRHAAGANGNVSFAIAVDLLPVEERCKGRCVPREIHALAALLFAGRLEHCVRGLQPPALLPGKLHPGPKHSQSGKFRQPRRQQEQPISKTGHFLREGHREQLFEKLPGFPYLPRRKGPRKLPA